MENKKLIPLSDFVLQQVKIKQSTSEFKEVVRDYTLFLKKPLKLEMFFPCEEGNLIEFGKYSFPTDEEMKQFQKAKENVLFEGFVFLERK